MDSKLFVIAIWGMSVGLQSWKTESLAASPYWVCVSNERSNDVTIFDGEDLSVVATIDVGKRPRGIHASPDGRRLYVALSGTPMSGPPQLDGQGNPIFAEERWDEADHAADGIGVIDLERLEFVKKLPSGSDPEEFAVSCSGRTLYISNEDVGTLTVLDVDAEQPTALVRVKQEPEGVALSPDGKFIYVTCETGGEIVVVDTALTKPVAEFTVGGRPRTVAFSSDGKRAYIPSETNAIVSVVDSAKHEVVRTISLPVGSRPMGAALSDDGRTLYVSNGRAGTISVIDTEGEVTHTISAGKRLWGIGLSPDGQRLYAADGPSDEVAVIDLNSGEPLARVSVGGSPWGIEIVPLAIKRATADR